MVSAQEKKIASASYIVNFYAEIETLTGLSSNYQNFILELESKSSGQASAKISEEEQKVITDLLQQIRYYAHQTYIRYMSIYPNLKMEQSKDIMEGYSKLQKTFILNREDILVYVMALHKFIVQDIIKTLLESSQTVVSDLYETAS